MFKFLVVFLLILAACNQNTSTNSVSESAQKAQEKWKEKLYQANREYESVLNLGTYPLKSLLKSPSSFKLASALINEVWSTRKDPGVWSIGKTDSLILLTSQYGKDSNSYKKVAGLRERYKSSGLSKKGFVIQAEYDAQNSYGATLRQSSIVEIDSSKGLYAIDGHVYR